MSKRVPSRQDLTVRSRRAIHGELWLLGTQRSEIWQVTGDQNTAFAPVAATVVEQGMRAAIADLWDAVPNPSNRKR